MKVAARDLGRMARPTGVGRALATYEIPILGQVAGERERACREALTGLRGEPIVARSIQLRRDGGGPELDGP